MLLILDKVNWFGFDLSLGSKSEEFIVIGEAEDTEDWVEAEIEVECFEFPKNVFNDIGLWWEVVILVEWG